MWISWVDIQWIHSGAQSPVSQTPTVKREGSRSVLSSGLAPRDTLPLAWKSLYNILSPAAVEARVPRVLFYTVYLYIYIVGLCVADFHPPVGTPGCIRLPHWTHLGSPLCNFHYNTVLALFGLTAYTTTSSHLAGESWKHIIVFFFVFLSWLTVEKWQLIIISGEKLVKWFTESDRCRLPSREFLDKPLFFPSSSPV